MLSDNQTAVSYLRNMGGTHSRTCNDITRETIMWCKERDISLTITHLPGILNIEANKASRVFHDDTEWSLDDKVFQSLVSRWGKPDIDLFASRLNAKLPCYVAWQSDPSAFAIDAFTLNRSVYNLIYCFPPFSVIARVLQKILQCQATAILVLPDWPTQFWYPRVTSMLVVPSSENKSSEENTDPSSRCHQTSPTLPQTPVDWLSCVRETLQSQGITGGTLNVIDSWRESTQKQYRTSVSAWIE